MERGERRVRFRGKPYTLVPLGPDDPERIALAEGEPAFARRFAPERFVAGRAVAPDEAPDDLLGFYAVAHSGDPGVLDDTLIFVSPRARGQGLSHLLIWGVYRDLLERPGIFHLSEPGDVPRLDLHVRCGFAPPVRPLVDGRIRVGKYDLHTVLARLESEDEIEPLGEDEEDDPWLG
ncbi:hypothetical protein [Deferrisoma palaeochoriense]